MVSTGRGVRVSAPRVEVGAGSRGPCRSEWTAETDGGDESRSGDRSRTAVPSNLPTRSRSARRSSEKGSVSLLLWSWIPPSV